MQCVKLRPVQLLLAVIETVPILVCMESNNLSNYDLFIQSNSNAIIYIYVIFFSFFSVTLLQELISTKCLILVVVEMCS